MTTTITTRSRSSSRCLTRTKGRCANDGANGDFVFDDEEINSVEAEGQSEKQLLTAALVTSTVELRGSGATVSDPTHTAMKGAPPPKPSAINSRITSAAKSVRRSPRKTPPSTTTNPVGSNMNPTLVPNPLAFHPPSISSKGGGGTKKPSVQTSSLMSAAPQHAQPVPNPVPSLATSSGSGTGSHFGGQLATMAESAASQDFQSDGLATNEVVVPQARGRIFSIDLDPSVLDFVDPLMDSTKDRSGSDPSVGRVPYSRDRGFSFECFSFGISQDEPVPPVPTSSGVPVAHGIRPRGDSIVSQGTRPRGDSIIYDPCSFGDGGIHEASALLHMKQGRGSSIDEGKPSSREAQNPDPPAPAEAKAASEESEPPRKEPYHAKTRSKAKYTPPTHPEPPKLPPPSTVSSFSPHPTREDTDTKRMPRRDSAPAPTGVSQFSSSVPSEAFSTTHAATACPMELINKGGRIGIYLPEERKARIAKFHSKRKNRTWRKKIKYDCRKKLADGRPRIKGRFVKRSDVDP